MGAKTSIGVSKILANHAFLSKYADLHSIGLPCAKMENTNKFGLFFLHLAVIWMTNHGQSCLHDMFSNHGQFLSA